MASKQMKVPRGTARALRRVGLVKDWRIRKGVKPMLPSLSPVFDPAVLAAASSWSCS